MSNLNGLRQVIALAMRDGKDTVTVSLETAQKIVIESEKYCVSAINAAEEIEAARSIMERVNGEKQAIITAADELLNVIFSTDAIDDDEAAMVNKLIENYRAACKEAL